MANSTALLGSAVPLCTERYNGPQPQQNTARICRTVMYRNVTFHLVAVCWRHSAASRARRLTRTAVLQCCSAYLQFPASHLPVRPATLLLIRGLNLRFGSTRQGNKIHLIFPRKCSLWIRPLWNTVRNCRPPWLLLDRGTMVRNITCGKFGAIERDLYGGRNGGFCCIWKDLEIEWINISLVVDNLMTCKENEMNVDFLINCCLSEMW
jgi:hypothetical protein